MTLRAFKPAALFGLIGLLITACGSDNQSDALSDSLLASGKALFTRNTDEADKGQQAVAGLTRAQIETSKQPLVRLRLEVNGTLATAAALGRNGDTLTYLMGPGQAVYLKNGIMTGTRGLGNDLMSLALSNATVMDAQRAQQTRRTYRFLNSEGFLYSQSVSCAVSSGPRKTLTQAERAYKVIPVTETCQGDDLAFTNEYLIDAGTGQVWRSTQWISPVAGRIRIEHLKQ